MEERLQVKRVAVLGAGVMGAQIAAHMVNAGINTFLYDLSSEKGDKNTVVLRAIKQLKKLKPSPLAYPSIADLLKAKNYDSDVSELNECDLVIEAVAERIDIKTSLYKTITPHLAKHAVLVSNTSGLSINALKGLLPENMHSRFCGVHFFNPPRYMHLLELIPSDKTAPSLLDQLESFFVCHMGKGVIRAKDTPNFIANRIGVFSMIATLYHAARLNIGFDTVDALTGPLIGRPKSATFRTMDIVGLDTMAHVVKTMQESLKDDPWHAHFNLPEWMQTLIQKGALGQKSGAGIYRKQDRKIQVLDVANQTYVDANPVVSDELIAILKTKDVTKRFELLSQSNTKEAQFLLACFSDVFHYAAYHLETIAENVRDIDLAMRWGFGWHVGPFETWQLAGKQSIQSIMQHAIDDKQSMAGVALPTWLDGCETFYTDQGAYNARQKAHDGRSELTVYKKQLSKDLVLGETPLLGDTVFDHDAVRLWTLDNDIAILSFKSKANCIGDDVLAGMESALDIAERDFKGVVIWQKSTQHFSAGANLKQFVSLFEKGKEKRLREVVYQFQRVALRLKYSTIPTIAAVRGLALGGGCEFLMHCDEAVCAFESYVGLVEMGVGLLPAGGGLKELARRAVRYSKGNDAFSLLESYFKMVAMGEVSASASDAKRRNFLKPNATIVMNAHEVLYIAIEKARYLSNANYLPPMNTPILAQGRDAIARLNMIIVNMAEGGFISQHDKFIAEKMAYVISGGDLDHGEVVDEEWYLKLEIDAFVELANTEKTKARVLHLLKTGKPLRN